MRLFLISSLLFLFYLALEIIVMGNAPNLYTLVSWLHLISAFYLYAYWMNGRWRWLWSILGAIFALTPLINIFYYKVYGRALESSLVIAMLREPLFVIQTFWLFIVNNPTQSIFVVGAIAAIAALLYKFIRSESSSNPWRWLTKWWMLLLMAFLIGSQVKWSVENDVSMIYTRSLIPIALYAFISVMVAILLDAKLSRLKKILGLSLVVFYMGFHYLFNTQWRPVKPFLTNDSIMSLSFTNAFFQISAYPSLKQTLGAQDLLAQIPTLPADAPNLVIFMHDSLRTKSLWSYGYNRDTDRVLAALIKKSAIFKQAYSPSNYTDTSVPAMFTGIASDKHPDRIRENLRLWDYFSKDYFTFYVVTQNPHFGKLVDFYSSVGLKQLWSAYHDSGKVFNPDTVDDIESFKHMQDILRENKRFFGVWHTQATHFPYKQAQGFETWGPCSLEYKGWPETLTNCYDNSITYISDLVQKTLQPMDLNKTIVIITSDHGEGFGEHGSYFHNQDLHNESIRVPLIIYIPPALFARLPADWQKNYLDNVSKPVGTVDLVPTVIDLYSQLYGVKFPINRNEMSGQSLFTAQKNRVLISTGCFMDYRCYSRDFALNSSEASAIYLFKDGGHEHFLYQQSDVDQKNPLPTSGSSPEAIAAEKILRELIDQSATVHFLPRLIKAGQ